MDYTWKNKTDPLGQVTLKWNYHEENIAEIQKIYIYNKCI